MIEEFVLDPAQSNRSAGLFATESGGSSPHGFHVEMIGARFRSNLPDLLANGSGPSAQGEGISPPFG